MELATAEEAVLTPLVLRLGWRSAALPFDFAVCLAFLLVAVFLVVAGGSGGGVASISETGLKRGRRSGGGVYLRRCKLGADFQLVEALRDLRRTAAGIGLGSAWF